VVEDRQLTLRAALTGLLLGGLLCLSNLYVVLKTGWSLGVTITSAIVAFGLFRLLARAGVLARPLSALDNVMVASIASSGAWMTGGGNMAALPALLLLTGQRPDGLAMVAWFALIASLGVVVAMPLRARFLEQERLPFPMSVATAQAIAAMHGTGDARPARLLARAALATALFTLWRDSGMAFAPPGRLSVPALSTWGLGLETSGVLLGGGSLMRPRTAGSLLLGTVLTWAVLAPLALHLGLVGSPAFQEVVQLSLWPAAALLTSAALSSFLLQGLSALRAAAHSPAGPLVTAPQAGLFLALGLPLVLLMRALFQIPLWAGLAALPLSVLVGVVGARVTGETDVTPTKAMGPLSQLAFGLALPGQLPANVMGANVTAGVGLHAADLLSDLKTGQALGASVPKQTLAQFLGIAVGAAVVVPAFTALVPDASALGTERFPAPAVMVWAGVSRVLAGGLEGLPPGALPAMTGGALLGLVLTLLERALPPRARALLPSPAALGISMVLPAATALTMVAGAALGQLARRRLAPDSLPPVASGLIAGESVTGALMALVRAAG
jgi:uncharacterized oligopeptide transporter (OPT) family protein